ncbi:unnamed protein product [Closterium sp. NIES-64]|nr:unnamed protein product [Closterium sp. NIES-64]
MGRHGRKKRKGGGEWGKGAGEAVGGRGGGRGEWGRGGGGEAGEGAGVGGGAERESGLGGGARGRSGVDGGRGGGWGREEGWGRGEGMEGRGRGGRWEHGGRGWGGGGRRGGGRGKGGGGGRSGSFAGAAAAAAAGAAAAAAAGAAAAAAAGAAAAAAAGGGGTTSGGGEDKAEITCLPLGAGQDVGKSCVVVRVGGRVVMFDCGMHMGYQDARRFPAFPRLRAFSNGQHPQWQRQDGEHVDYTGIIDCVIITHFHLDHCGALPYFTQACGYQGPVYMTHFPPAPPPQYPTKALAPLMLEEYRRVAYPTKALAPLMLEDYRRVAYPTKALAPLMLEDYRRVAVERRGEGEEGLFSSADITAAVGRGEGDEKAGGRGCGGAVRGRCGSVKGGGRWARSAIPVDIHQSIQVNEHITITPYYAGHVLGAAMFHVQASNGASVLYTGDFNMAPDRHLGAARVDPRLRPDLMISESTYATTIRESRRSREADFLSRVHTCVAARGKVLIPVFAMGRAQELCVLLDEYWHRMGLDVPIYLSAGLTSQATVFYKTLLTWTNQHIQSAHANRNIFDFRHVRPFDRALLDAPAPMVLFATPGMLSGGLSLQAFKAWAPHPCNLLVLPGVEMGAPFDHRSKAVCPMLDPISIIPFHFLNSSYPLAPLSLPPAARGSPSAAQVLHGRHSGRQDHGHGLRQCLSSSLLLPASPLLPPRFCMAGTVGGKIMAMASANAAAAGGGGGGEGGGDGGREGGGGGGGRVAVDQSTQVVVNCQVHVLSFSPHTDAKGITDLIRHLAPRHVILVHGERAKMAQLRDKIADQMGIPCFTPANHETVRVPATVTQNVTAPPAMVVADGLTGNGTMGCGGEEEFEEGDKIAANLAGSSWFGAQRWYSSDRGGDGGREENDVVIIGGGPGGYAAAIRAAQVGLKSLLESSRKFYEAKHSLAQHGVRVDGVSVDLAAMMALKADAIESLTSGVERMFEQHRVNYVKGAGRITGTHEVTVSLLDADGQVGQAKKVLSAKNIIIATGSDIRQVPGVPIDEKKIVSSTGAMCLEKVPEKMLVVGGGVIGLEMGSVWSRLGADVTILEFADGIGGYMDNEIRQAYHRILESQGLKFLLGTKVVRGDASGEGVVLQVAPAKGEGEAREVHADVVMVAAGRVPCTNGLGLDEVGVKRDMNGRIFVDSHFRSTRPTVYAIGDVIPGPMLAHKAEEDAIACVENIMNGHGQVNYATVPGIIYTHPEVAMLGMTEEELQATGMEYTVGKFPFKANSRARAMGEVEGFVKILADKETDLVLGAHILGPSAGELIMECVLAMEHGATTLDLARTCHAHPTLTEAVKEAALAAHGKPIHSDEKGLEVGAAGRVGWGDRKSGVGGVRVGRSGLEVTRACIGAGVDNRPDRCLTWVMLQHPLARS